MPPRNCSLYCSVGVGLPQSLKPPRTNMSFAYGAQEVCAARAEHRRGARRHEEAVRIVLGASSRPASVEAASTGCRVQVSLPNRASVRGVVRRVEDHHDRALGGRRCPGSVQPSMPIATTPGICERTRVVELARAGRPAPGRAAGTAASSCGSAASPAKLVERRSREPRWSGTASRRVLRSSICTTCPRCLVGDRQALGPLACRTASSRAR